MRRDREKGNCMKPRPEHFRPWEHCLFAVLTVLTMALCVCVGSVNISLPETLATIGRALRALWQGDALPGGAAAAILLSVRIPRVLCVALVGAALSLSGAAMQGLLKNPLADGSTLGVSSGAALGAVSAIAFGITFPGLPFAGTVVMAVLSAFLSLLILLGLAARLDHSLSTNSVILLGVVFSMFASSLIDILITFAPDRLRNITFWTLGSLQGKGYADALLLFVSLAVFGGVILLHSRELNAFALGEEDALQVGVNIRRVRLTILVAVSGLIGVCVSESGSIGFVGLVTPHIVRMVTGPNHHRLLPASLFAGATFLLLADLAARSLFDPVELPIGVVTSLVGAAVFLAVLFRSRKR